MKPQVYVTRRLPQQALQALQEACIVDIWDEEYPPSYETIREHVADKQGLICLLTDRIDDALLAAAPQLKVISQVAVGFDNIDVAAATARGIPVGHTPGVLTDATADFAWMLLMAAARRVGEGIAYVKEGKWRTWGLTLLLGADVAGATLGIIGMGRIGQAVAKRAHGFGMKILYHSTSPKPAVEAAYGAIFCELDDLLRTADYVTLHVNLNEQTRGLIDARALALMKESAILINTARGPVVKTDDLYQALRNGSIAYAALDVTDPEPLPPDHPLLTLPNCIVTPHIGSATRTARSKMAMMAVQNLLAGLRGEPLPHQVNRLR